MGTITALKLIAAQSPAKVSAVQQRRNKLAKRLWEQSELAKAKQAGTQFSPVRIRSITDPETGLRKTVEMNKRVKAWWFTTENGKLALSVRYGTKQLELAKGKWAVEVANERDLVAALDTIRQAVLDGELDAAIETASIKLREGFER